MPPAPERVDRFVHDPDPLAYEKLIDELLASPQYGERWGRHWLDVARYADTGGYETDIYFKNAWRYRDYVVKSTPNTPFDGLLEVPTAAILGPELPELVPPIHVLSRGDVGRSKQRATPGVPVVLAEKTNSPSALPSGSGSRKALALWLTAPSHPLTARVMVNRIWAWHFDRGLVATPNDFGHMGQAPSHPELLDWLAAEFVDRKWSIKSLHRLIMLSRTYQQSSAFSSDRHQELDPDNRLLWRMNRRRLEGEELWDALHAIAGTLNLSLGGRPVMPPLAPEELTDKAAWVVNADPQQHVRRGLYVVVRRNFRFPLFDTFDAPVNAVSCAGRDCSTVAPQALWLLNNNLADRESQQLAARVIRESGNQPSDWVALAWRFTLQRLPTPEESREALALLERLRTRIEQVEPTDQSVQPPAIPAAQVEALEQLCLALFNLNEFLYVD